MDKDKNGNRIMATSFGKSRRYDVVEVKGDIFQKDSYVVKVNGESAGFGHSFSRLDKAVEAMKKKG